MTAHHAAAERRLGRKLSEAELRVDVERQVAVLERGKKRIHDAMLTEQRKLARLAARRGHGHLGVPGEVTAALNWLREEGRREALKELRAIGVEPPRVYARAPRAATHRITQLVQLLARSAESIGRRVVGRAVEMDLSGEASAAIVRAGAKVPGALDAASRLVSPAFLSGMGDVFSQAQDLIAGWQYSAVLDGGTCENCSSKDGTEYGTWDEAQQDLPDGGPNPECDGDTRCRCRLVPTGAAA